MLYFFVVDRPGAVVAAIPGVALVHEAFRTPQKTTKETYFLDFKQAKKLD